MRTCTNCGRENPDDGVYCSICGRSLDAKPVASPRGHVCPYCGQIVSEFLTFCQYCSRDIMRGSVSTPSQIAESPSSTSRYGDDVEFRVSQDTYAEVVGRRSSRPAIAGVLLIGAGLLDIFTSSQLWRMTSRDLPDYPIDISGLVDFCAVLVLILGLIAVIGGVLALKRKHFVLVIIAAVAGMLGVGPFYLAFVLGLIGIIAAATSYDEFH